MLTYEEALERVISSAGRVEAERVDADQARGRVLAEPLVLTRPLPAFDYSAMDGYAVHHEDFGGDPPWHLPVAGESRTGHPVPQFERGTACRIFTGAQLPEGATAIVMQEDVVREADRATLSATPAEGQHVRRAGEDLPVGATALDAGTRIGPYQLGLIASLDRTVVTVARAPRVAILSTGDELRKPGSPDRPGSIPESNSSVIAALTQWAGGVPNVEPPSSDDADATRARISRALEAADVLVTIGGVSVGDHDVVRPALEAAGATLDFWKVAIKPGKPLVLGRAGGAVILGLPGNPVSAQLTFTLFGLPLLCAMQGQKRDPLRRSFLPLARDVPHRPGRRGFYRAILDGRQVAPLDGQSSGATTSLASADCLIVVPQESEGARAGQVVEVVHLPS